MTTASHSYRGFCFPAAVIEQAVRLYDCFSLSLRDAEIILAARAVVVSYQSIREWGLRFGRQSANTLKRRRPKLGDKWHLNGVFIGIRGKQHHLWRAIDQHGPVLVILVQSRRNTGASKRFSRKMLRPAIRAKGLPASPTSSEATPPPSAQSCRACSTGKAKT